MIAGSDSVWTLLARAVQLAALAVLAALILSGCAIAPQEPITRTVEVKVPVPVPCKAHVDARPHYADQDAGAKPDIFEQTKALLTGIQQRAAREQKLENAVTSCGGTVQ